MRYLLDTCVISEMIKPQPEEKVIAWIRSCEEDKLMLSVITIGEIQKGISKLPGNKRKRKLQQWVDEKLKERFMGRIVAVDIEIAQKWGEILAYAEGQGKVIPAIDALIAATGIVHNLTVVTRNVSDMNMSGVLLFNPWG